MQRSVFQRYMMSLGIVILIGMIISIVIIPSITVTGIVEFQFDMGNIFKMLTPDYKEDYINWLKVFWVVYALAVLIIWYNLKDKREYDNIEHGSSDWAKNGEQYKELSKNKGFVLAEKHLLSPTRRGNLNILVAGGSGSGKSAAYVIPTATQLLGSYVFTDPKGELFDRTAGFFKKHGYQIQTLNLVKPEFSDAYNPLLHIRNEIDVDIIVNTIVKGQGDNKSSDPFWDDMAEILLKSLIYYLLATRPKEEQSLASCANLVRAANNGGGESLLNKLMSELPADHPARINYQSIEVASDKTFGSILSTLQSKLGKFDSKEIQGVTSSNTIDFDLLGKKKVALYVIPPDSHSAYNFILTIFFAQMIQQLYDFADSNGGKLKEMVIFMLDEFANIGKIPDFEKKISTSRSRNIAFSVIIQTIDQLVDLYGEAAETIMANCDTHLFLGGNSLKTAEHFSKALGEKTIIRDSISTSRDKDDVKSGKSYSDQVMARPLMTPDEVRRLDPDNALILVKGIKPIQAKKYYYFLKPIAKELRATEISHNDIKNVQRNEWKIYNPLKIEEEKRNVSFNQPKVEPKVVFDENTFDNRNEAPKKNYFEEHKRVNPAEEYKKKFEESYQPKVEPVVEDILGPVIEEKPKKSFFTSFKSVKPVIEEKLVQPTIKKSDIVKDVEKDMNKKLEEMIEKKLGSVAKEEKPVQPVINKSDIVKDVEQNIDKKLEDMIAKKLSSVPKEEKPVQPVINKSDIVKDVEQDIDKKLEDMISKKLESALDKKLGSMIEKKIEPVIDAEPEVKKIAHKKSLFEELQEIEDKVVTESTNVENKAKSEVTEKPKKVEKKEIPKVKKLEEKKVELEEVIAKTKKTSFFDDDYEPPKKVKNKEVENVQKLEESNESEEVNDEIKELESFSKPKKKSFFDDDYESPKKVKTVVEKKVEIPQTVEDVKKDKPFDNEQFAYDIQKELEKKFDELFNSDDEE